MDKNLLLLFDRPNEPVFMPKGEDKVTFEVPPEYLVEKYQPMAQRILTRFSDDAETSVPIKQIAIPDLTVPLSLSRQDAFSLFIPFHREMAAHLTKLFMGMRTVDDLISLAAYCRDRINSQMFVYSLSIAILHRPDTKHLSIPQLTEIFPDKYMDRRVFKRATEEANVIPTGLRPPIEIPMDYTATNADPEHRVAYWREDVGVNLHHWHWHLVYPFNGPIEVVRKDRRGEIFYYMHRQIMARYNVERLCNDLGRTTPLMNLLEPIQEAYFPKLDQTVAGRSWPSRPVGQTLSDINRQVDRIRFNLTDLEVFRDRILEAITTRSVRTSQGQILELDDNTGIDILASAIESNILSPNMNYYGDLHNLGHVAFAYCHDPDHRFLESFGVMADSATSMRDPVFYRWHAFIDIIFAQFKNSLQPYSLQQLFFPGVTVTDINISSPNSNPNTLNCYWTKSDVDLSRGLDFIPRGSILARLQHLNHDDYSYSITVNNTNNQDVMGTVRIFMAPRYDETGGLLSFNDQRMLMIEMDKFTTRLERGTNLLSRNSVDSSVTIPFEATFRDMSKNRPSPDNVQSYKEYNFCGCGWPQHLLIPKGNGRGFPMDLFIMISNYEFDRVDQPGPTGCRDGVSYCGLRDLKYPDARAMGFPFDRAAPIQMTSEFLTPNMRLQEVTVIFSDTIKPRQTADDQTVVRV